MIIVLNCDSNDFTIDNNYITQFQQEANLFAGQSFYVGSTVCRAFTLSIDKRAVPEMPYGVELYDDNNQIYASLVVDNIDDSDTKVYTFSLADKMIKLNEQNSDWYDSEATILELLENIGSVFDIGVPEQLPAYGSKVISWYNGWTAREFVGWLAELLGGYAYISNDNVLCFANYSNTPAYTVSVADCSSFKLGEQITIDRVVYNSPNKTVVYPGDYNGSGCTLYLNTENALFTDSEGAGLSIESEVQYIYNQINGFSFYDVKVDKCPINGNVRAGNCIAFTLGNDSYNTIAQVKWDYNTRWVGGYELNIDSPIQQETQIINPIVKMGYNITQKIDYENGVISSTVSSLQETVNSQGSTISDLSTTVQQLPDKIQFDIVKPAIDGVNNDLSELQDQVDDNETELKKITTSVIVDDNGVTVKKSNSTVRGVFGNTELDFIDSSSGTDITQAWIGKDGLGGRELNVGDPNTQANQWRIFASSDGSHLRFTRHS